MDGNNPSTGSQNGQQQGGQQKTGLSWSQPQTNPTSQKPIIQQTNTKPPATTPSNTQTQNGGGDGNKKVAIGLGVLLVIVLIIWAIAATRTPSTTNVATTASTTTMGTDTMNSGTSTAMSNTNSSNSLTVASPQPAGLQVTVSNVVVSVPTWVVIYEDSNGKPGNVLGAALFSSNRTSGEVALLRATLPSTTYFVGEAVDDGDRMYSLQTDSAVRDTDGNLMVVQFQTQ